MAALTDLERRLVETAVAGQTLDLRAAPERELRAGLVRDVLLGEHGPVDARGLQVRGAALVGPLDLGGCTVGGPPTTPRWTARCCSGAGSAARGW